MNWSAIQTDEFAQNVLKHWQKLGLFRKNHPAVGAGIHQKINDKNYVFSRKWTQGKYTDQVVVGLDLPSGNKTISAGKIFPNGTKVRDAYSGKTALVTNGKITLNTPATLLLIEKQ
jgi:alpha-amylase